MKRADFALVGEQTYKPFNPFPGSSEIFKIKKFTLLIFTKSDSDLIQ